MLITVDNREDRKYLKILQSTFPEHEYSYEKIEEGDYVTNRCIVERKTISDLHNSIISGRLRSQLNRGLTHNKVYILLIVGDIHHYASKMRAMKIKFSEKMIYSTLASAIVKHNVHVIWTNTELDGFKIIVPIMEKFEKGQAITPTKLSHVVIISKLFGVSKVIAIEIIRKFISLENMIVATESDFMKIKGIGKVKARQIKNVLRGELDDNAYI